MHINECLLKTHIILRMALGQIETALILDAASCSTEFPHWKMLES